MLVRFNKLTQVNGTDYSPESGEVDLANDLADQVVRQGNGEIVGLGAVSSEMQWNPGHTGPVEPVTGAPRGLPLTIAQTGLAMIMSPTGSMADNGAVTLGTALDQTYANCYLYLPANAIYTGSAAGAYYCVMSSTTAGTVYNNLYVSGVPTIPAAPVAFATTGPGAYTGVTTSQELLSIAVPGNSLGKNGILEIEHYWNCPNNANAKTVAVQYGGVTVMGTSLASGLGGQFLEEVRNLGATNSQIARNQSSTYGPAGANSPLYRTVDTTAAQNVSFKMQLAVATDYAVLRATRVTARPFS